MSEITFIALGASSGVFKSLKPLLQNYSVLEFYRRAPDVNLRTNQFIYGDVHEVAEKLEAIATKRMVFMDFRVLKLDSLIATKDLADLRAELEVNVFQHFYACKLIAEIMRKRRWGRLIHLGSRVAMNKEPGIIGYSISKHAILGLSKSFSAEYSRCGVTSNVININYFESGLFNRLSEAQKVKFRSESINGSPPNVKQLYNEIDLLIENDKNGTVIDLI